MLPMTNAQVALTVAQATARHHGNDPQNAASVLKVADTYLAWLDKNS